MHLTQFTDYSLRLVIYLACHPDQVISVDEISRAFGISRHHLVKVVQTLTELGVVGRNVVEGVACGSRCNPRRSTSAG